MDANQETAARLRAVLAARRISARRFAVQINHNHAWLTRRLNGQSPILINDLHLMASALDMPMTALIPDEPDPWRVSA